MSEAIGLHGMVLQHKGVGEYDWLVTLLTAERGKINCFARGARRPGGKLSGNVEPFCFGTFVLYEGRSSYVLSEARVDQYFDAFRSDLEKASYGTYFLELASHFSRENLEAPELLNLLYLTCRVIESDGTLPHPLIRSVFELRLYVTEGIFPGAEAYPDAHPALQQALHHIATCPLKKLYTFTLAEEPLRELLALSHTLRRRFVDRKLLSLEMLALYEAQA